MIQLLVVHEALVFCKVISAALRQESDIEVVGIATTEEETLERVSRGNMVLICLARLDDSAVPLIKAIKKAEPTAKILVMGLPKSEEPILRHFEAGADGYVLQEDSMLELLKNLRSLHRGEALASPQIVAALINRLANLAELHRGLGFNTNPDKLKSLTPREQEVLLLISEGLSNQEISERLTIELGTVKNHVHNVLQKLEVNNRWEATAYTELLKSSNQDENKDQAEVSE